MAGRQDSALDQVYRIVIEAQPSFEVGGVVIYMADGNVYICVVVGSSGGVVI